MSASHRLPWNAKVDAISRSTIERKTAWLSSQEEDARMSASDDMMQKEQLTLEL